MNILYKPFTFSMIVCSECRNLDCKYYSNSESCNVNGVGSGIDSDHQNDSTLSSGLRAEGSEK